MVINTGGGGGTIGDGGLGDGGLVGDGGAVGDAGVAVSGRVCIVRDLRLPTSCDATVSAAGVRVTLGGRTPAAPPAATGEFTIIAPLGTDLVWRATGANLIPTVMPFGTDNTIPVVPDGLYTDLVSQNHAAIAPAGQGSVVVRAVTGASSAPGVTATSNLVSANLTPLYDADNSRTDWREVGPTQSAGVMWFPGVNVTTTPARVTLTRNGGTPVVVSVDVEELAITFVTQDVP